jgi:hypothetical protein
VDLVATLDPFRRRRRGPHVEAGRRVGERAPDEHAARREREDHAGVLLAAREGLGGGAEPEEVHVRGERRRRAAAGQDRLGPAHRGKVGARAAELLRDRQGEIPGLLEAREVLVGEPALAVHLAGAGTELGGQLLGQSDHVRAGPRHRALLNWPDMSVGIYRYGRRIGCAT